MDEGELDRLLKRVREMDLDRSEGEEPAQAGQAAGLDAEDRSRAVRRRIERRFEELGVFPTPEALERAIASDPEFIGLNKPRLDLDDGPE